MVDDVVNFIKMNETDWTRNFIKYDLGEYLESYEKYAQSTGSVFNRNVTSEIKVPRETYVKMDKQLVSRALENIFSNALRYTADSAEINISADLFADKAKITIADKGSGMSPEDTEHVFELFYRGTKSRREQGHGIGLLRKHHRHDAAAQRQLPHRARGRQPRVSSAQGRADPRHEG